MTATAFASPARRLTLLGTEVFAIAAVPMLAINDDGVIVDANDAAAALLLIERPALRQEPVARFVPELGGATLRDHVVAVRRQRGNVHAGPMSIRQRGGDAVDMHVVIGALREGVQWPILLLQLVPLSARGV